MKKFASLVSILALGFAMASPIANADSSSGSTQETTSTPIVRVHKGKGTALSACLTSAVKARSTADKAGRTADSAAVKAARATYNAAVKAARAAYKASAKDAAARTTLKTALKSANATYRAAIKAAGITYKSVRTTDQSAWKTAHSSCVAAK